MTVAVIGGGITGLTAAFRLTKAGHSVRVFEKSARVGGSIRTTNADGWLSEGGPNSLLDDGGEAAQLIRGLGLGPERIEASREARNRYVLRGGKPIAGPASPGRLLACPLFSLGTKLRILAEPFTGSRTNAPDASVAEFARSHFGPELVDYVVRPMISGVYAGDADKLSAKYAFPRIWSIEQESGSLIRGAMRLRKGGSCLISFRAGLQVLVDALVASLPASCLEHGAAVERLIPGNQWIVVSRSGEREQADRFDRVILALPPPALASLIIGAGAERPLASLGAIICPPVSSLFLGFKRAQVAHPLDGFGVLVPPAEKRSFLGALFSSSLFPGRAPEGHVALTVVAGGALQPAMAMRSADDLWKAVRKDLAETLGVQGEPACMRLSNWPAAIPQYNLGYGAHLDTMAAVEKANAGLYIGGNGRDGISVPDCIRSGIRLAELAVS